MVAHRFEVYLVPLDPVVGSEMAKTRPCAVISPNAMNHLIRTVIVAPLTSTDKLFPFRVPCRFGGVSGRVALDHMRAVDKSRLIRRLGNLDATTATSVAEKLVGMFG